MKEAPEHHEESSLYHAPRLHASFQGLVPRPLLQGPKMVHPPGPWFVFLRSLIQAGDQTGLSQWPQRGPVVGPGHC